MDKYHYILIGLFFLLLTAFLLSKNTTNDYKKEVDKIELEKKELLKKIKAKDLKIKELKEVTLERDTIINVVINKKNESKYGDSIRALYNADDTIVWKFLTDRYIKDSTSWLRY